MDFSLSALEYHRLKELLGRYVSTDAGRLALEQLTPGTDEKALEEKVLVQYQDKLPYRETLAGK